MKKNSLNINIVNDDYAQNDYLYTWSDLNIRPSKTTILGYFKPDPFLKYLESFDVSQISEFTDVIPNEEVSITNQKNFICLDNDIYLTYTHLDKEHEESIISDVTIFYSLTVKDKIEKFVDSLTKITLFSEETTEQEVSKNLSILNFGQNGFELEYFENNKEFEDIEYYYENEVLKSIKKVIKSLKKEKKGLTILCGERGCGKTNLLSYVSSKTDKNFIFIPCNTLESSLVNPDFRKFLKVNKNSVLIIDDAELYFSQMFSKSNLSSLNLLQLIEGIHSDTLNVNIILSLNCDKSEVDKTILESNEIIDIIEVGKLSVSKIEELYQFLDKKCKIKSPTKLVDVIKNKCKLSVNELGFK